jgi:hypothetical protein
MIDMDSAVILDSLLEVYSVDHISAVSIEDDGTLMRCNLEPPPTDPPKVRYASKLPAVSVVLIDLSLRALEVQSDIIALISPFFRLDNMADLLLVVIRIPPVMLDDAAPKL